MVREIDNLRTSDTNYADSLYGINRRTHSCDGLLEFDEIPVHGAEQGTGSRLTESTEAGILHRLAEQSKGLTIG